MSDFYDRLSQYLTRGQIPYTVHQLSQDASTREYFRVLRGGTSSIACVYPEPFVAAEQSYLDVTALFLKAQLPVAKILDFDEDSGVIMMEDLGDMILREVLIASTDAEKEALIDSAIGLIARIQSATNDAFGSNSIAGRLKFDEEKLLWELNFFREHYFTTYRGRSLSPGSDANVINEFTELARDLESRASVLCHRDFHAANLMVDQGGGLHIIDHQDARIGTASYDLVSLLLDRVTTPPAPEWLAEKRALLLTRRVENGLPEISEDDLAMEFRLQTIQRCLKAVGTFSYQSATRGKTYFEPFIKPMFEIVLRAIRQVGRFPELHRLVEQEVDSSDAS